MNKPNLLFIFTDQQRWDTLERSGVKAVITPYIDSFAKTCTVFQRAYVTQPICTPSRSSIMTGLYPHTSRCTENNIGLAEKIPCLTEMLTDTDWVTAYYGKWHLGDEIFSQHGFTEWISTEDMYSRYYSHEKDKTKRSDYHHYLISQGYKPENNNFFTRMDAAKLPEQYSKPAFLSRKACDFIKKNSKRPFILYVNFLEPHPPYYGPRNNYFNIEEIDTPKNFSETGPKKDQSLKSQLLYRYYNKDNNSLREDYRDIEGENLPLRNVQDWKKIIAYYRGLCNQVDTHVGKILSVLEEEKLLNNTIVVYTSDHGDMMGSHRLLGKEVMFEEAIRVPLLVKLPGQHKARTITKAVSQIDLVPTLLELLGQKIPASVQGQSLTPILKSSRKIQKDDIFIEWTPARKVDNPRRRELDNKIIEIGKESMKEEDVKTALYASARTVITQNGWKYNWYDNGEEELYNLKTDLLENVNLAHKTEYINLIKELKDKIYLWQQKTGDTLTVN